ncbi:hypothetical protein [Xanthomonas campestris]|uniref:hypothetical protein n=2 Tax=Xanthomonas campestris TaxID=339 RepID=UPI001E30D7FF|nr:hypothetical protein [Xanthomonas campestris]MCC5069416.1 hypothetical protein [Xanthomonas campestris]MCC5085867.1 hypothetical protein [Xanthomonas campestris]
MKGMNGFLRMLAVPICAGFGAAMFFLLASFMHGNYFKEGAAGSMAFFAIFGSIMGAFIGCPLIILVDWKWSKLPCRYVVSAMLGSIFGWLLLDGAFVKGAWVNVWASGYFWSELMPKRLFGYSAIGFISGLFYTGFVALINRFFTPLSNGGN